MGRCVAIAMSYGKVASVGRNYDTNATVQQEAPLLHPESSAMHQSACGMGIPWRQVAAVHKVGRCYLSPGKLTFLLIWTCLKVPYSASMFAFTPLR